MVHVTERKGDLDTACGMTATPYDQRSPHYNLLNMRELRELEVSVFMIQRVSMCRVCLETLVIVNCMGDNNA